MASKGAAKAEVLQFRSPAEFFAENQNIAGFDNPGKALYTTLREFVENALDAAESVSRLPDISISIEEMDAPSFERFRTLTHSGQKGGEAMAQVLADSAAGAAAGSKAKRRKSGAVDDDGEADGVAAASAAAAAAPAPAAARSDADGDSDYDAAADAAGDGDEDADDAAGGKPKKKSAGAGKKAAGGAATGSSSSSKAPQTYFRITCRDNGCGMPHASIPNMLGRVLAGSKYGVRQTRGKFGLGAKMALIWSKKSTGLPIEVTTAHTASGVLKAASARAGAASAGGGDDDDDDGDADGADAATSPRAHLTGVGASGTSGGGGPYPARVSYCKLDIDIYKNQPHVLVHTQVPNSWAGLPGAAATAAGAGDDGGSAGGAAVGSRAVSGAKRPRSSLSLPQSAPSVSASGGPWLGTEISVVISGAWSAYRSHIMHYFQQLAVITPYAQFKLRYASVAAGGAGRSGGRSASGTGGDFEFIWRRRSTVIPRPPQEVKHHPSAVNDLLISQLIQGITHCGKDKRGAVDGAGDSSVSSSASAPKSGGPQLASFLCTQFQCIDRAMATTIIDAVPAGEGLTESTPVGSLTARQIHSLRVAVEAQTYSAPNGACLSPAGEYNLRLGVLKEVRPELVATAVSPVCVFQGHPFIVEAAVCLGGGGREGITVHRFANRIPLLFEGGGDVATQTALKRIPWGSYKIDSAKDRVGVFVSLVSTKIPFKGTGKEYIGDDIAEIKDAVRQTLLACCVQLRVKLLRAHELRARAGRRKTLLKYVPDVVRSLSAFLKSAAERRALAGAGAAAASAGDGSASGSSSSAAAGAGTGCSVVAADVFARHAAGDVTDALLTKQLTTAVEKADLDAALEAAADAAAAASGLAAAGGSGKPVGTAVFIAPASQSTFHKLPALVTTGGGAVFKFLPAAIVSAAAGPGASRAGSGPVQVLHAPATSAKSRSPGRLAAVFGSAIGVEDAASGGVDDGDDGAADEDDGDGDVSVMLLPESDVGDAE